MSEICSRPIAHFIPHSEPFLILSITSCFLSCSFLTEVWKINSPASLTYLKWLLCWRRSGFATLRAEDVPAVQHGELQIWKSGAMHASGAPLAREQDFLLQSHLLPLAVARFPVWSDFPGFKGCEDGFSASFQVKSVGGKERRKNKGEDFFPQERAVLCLSNSFRLVVF